jgi:hypothetical protein
MATEDNYKYVGVRYFVERQSLWRIPAEWDTEQIRVRWDTLFYQGMGDPLLAVQIFEKREDPNEEEMYKTPDIIVKGTREELEDESIWFDCDDGETDSEDSETSEEPVS